MKHPEVSPGCTMLYVKHINSSNVNMKFELAVSHQPNYHSTHSKLIRNHFKDVIFKDIVTQNLLNIPVIRIFFNTFFNEGNIIK